MKLSRAQVVLGSVAAVALALFILGSSPIEEAPSAAEPPLEATFAAIEPSPTPTSTSASMSMSTPALAPATATSTAVGGATPEPGATSVIPTATIAPEPATPEPEATPEPGTSPTADWRIVEAVAAVRTFNPDNPASTERLNAVIMSGADVVPALARFLDDPDPARRWAAIYVIVPLTDTPEEVEILRQALDEPIPAFRVFAAAALAASGVVEALPVLIDGLYLPDDVPFSDPPRPIAPFARQTLEYYTRETHPTPDAWRAWWQSVGDHIEWRGTHFGV
jgi:hypothetical protein